MHIAWVFELYKSNHNCSLIAKGVLGYKIIHILKDDSKVKKFFLQPPASLKLTRTPLIMSRK